MDITICKKYIGVIATLVLIMLLSTFKTFDFLTETYLGKFVLLLLLIIIAHNNHILGLVAVLSIIIAFNKYELNQVHSYNYYEGFDVSGNASDASGNTMLTTILNDKENILKAKKNIIDEKIDYIQQNSPAPTTSTPTTPTTTTTSASTSGTEGFCMTDREINILRGKKSNTIPIFDNSREQSDDISPSDKSLFSSTFSFI